MNNVEFHWYELQSYLMHMHEMNNLNYPFCSLAWLNLSFNESKHLKRNLKLYDHFRLYWCEGNKCFVVACWIVLNLRYSHIHSLKLMFISHFYSTLQMLTNIESKLEELFESIETMPPEKVEAAEKVGSKDYYFSASLYWIQKEISNYKFIFFLFMVLFSLSCSFF